MPYIEQKDRPEIDEAIILAATKISTPGQLNYAISQLCWLYLNMKGIRYTNMNEVDGVLGCVQKEFYRRVVTPYEDEMIKKNGDVFNS